MHGTEHWAPDVDLTNNSNFVTVILLIEFKIPEPEEEPTIFAYTYLKADKTSMIFLLVWLIFPEAPVCLV